MSRVTPGGPVVRTERRGGRREGRVADDPGHRLGCREVDDRGRALPGRVPARGVRRPVQAAEHVEQRGGVPRRGRDRPGAGPPGPRGRARPDGGHEPGAAQAPVRPDLAGRSARPGRLDAGSGGLPRAARPAPRPGARELRAVGGSVRSRDRRGSGKRGGDEPARARHRQHGVRPPRGRPGLPPRGHRPGRGHRVARGNPGGARPGRRGDGEELRDQQVPGRSGALRGRGARHRAPHRVALPGGRPLAGGGPAASAGGRGGPRPSR